FGARSTHLAECAPPPRSRALCAPVYSCSPLDFAGALPKHLQSCCGREDQVDSCPNAKETALQDAVRLAGRRCRETKTDTLPVAEKTLCPSQFSFHAVAKCPFRPCP